MEPDVGGDRRHLRERRAEVFRKIDDLVQRGHLAKLGRHHLLTRTTVLPGRKRPVSFTVKCLETNTLRFAQSFRTLRVLDYQEKAARPCHFRWRETLQVVNKAAYAAQLQLIYAELQKDSDSDGNIRGRPYASRSGHSNRTGPAAHAAGCRRRLLWR